MSDGALSQPGGVENSFPAHGTDPFLVGTRLTVVRTDLMNGALADLALQAHYGRFLFASEQLVLVRRRTFLHPGQLIVDLVAVRIDADDFRQLLLACIAHHSSSPACKASRCDQVAIWRSSPFSMQFLQDEEV